MPAYDYSVLADIYDDFCVFNEDATPTATARAG
jgi:hypothetical protein